MARVWVDHIPLPAPKLCMRRELPVPPLRAFMTCYTQTFFFLIVQKHSFYWNNKHNINDNNHGKRSFNFTKRISGHLNTSSKCLPTKNARGHFLHSRTNFTYYAVFYFCVTSFTFSHVSPPSFSSCSHLSSPSL